MTVAPGICSRYSFVAPICRRRHASLKRQCCNVQAHTCCASSHARRKRPFSCTQATAAPAAETQQSTERAGESTRKQTSKSRSEKAFVWTKHWYPLMLEADLDTEHPTPHTLLNIKMVVWKDGEGKWGACEDRCPHRLAPLSEGRIQDGHLACNYHGWEFDTKGACLANPQSGKVANDAICKNDKAKARAFPTHIAQGLLWIWPESGPHSWLESAMQGPVLVPEVNDPNWTGHESVPVFSTWRANWDLWMENTMDPSHANWLHDGAVGKWEDAHPMRMRLVDSAINAHQGFMVEHDGYSKPTQEGGLRVTRQFQPPCTNRYVYEYSSGRVDVFAIYFTPISPGVTRSFFKLVTRNAPKGFSLVSKVPQWLFHNLSGTMSDQDAVMLHSQDYTLREEPEHWRGYFLPSQADRAVAAFRVWLHEKAGGDVGWANGATSADLPPKLTREQLLSRWDRHTKDCASCKKAMATIDKARTALTVGSAVLLLTALFTTAQNRSAITDSTLVELGAGAALLLVREALRRFNHNYIAGSGNVYNIRKKPAKKADAVAPQNPGVM